MSTIQGTIHGKTIELEQVSGLPDGQSVAVEIRPIPRQQPVPEGSWPWWLEHLDVDPHVRAGKFVIKGTPILADGLVAQVEAGLPDEDLLRLHPRLSAKDLTAVREYAKVPLELRRSFGAWADEAEELDEYLAWNRQQRKSTRREVDD